MRMAMLLLAFLPFAASQTVLLSTSHIATTNWTSAFFSNMRDKVEGLWDKKMNAAGSAVMGSGALEHDWRDYVLPVR